MPSQCSLITCKRLKKLLRYAPTTGHFTWRVRTWRHRGKKHAGTRNSCGYLVITIDGVQCHAHRLAWLYTHGKWPKEIDHWNNTRDDNRLRNLRDGTHQSNLWNQRRAHSRNKDSKTLGVFRSNPGYDRWSARICVDGKRIRLGGFATIEQASRAYRSAKKRYHKV